MPNTLSVKRKFYNRRALDIKIKKSKKNFIYLELLYILIVFFLKDILHFPSFITYLTDLLLVCSFAVSFGKIQKSIIKAQARSTFYIILLILLTMIIGALLNGINPLYFLWGFRNNFRFFIFFISCIVLLDKDDIDKIFKLFLFFFWINFAITLIQYFGFGLKKDYLGGIFGITQGCNTYSVIFLGAILCYKISLYFNSKITLFNLLIYLFTSLLIAVLAELKILYFELIICFILAILFSKPTTKTLISLLLCFIGIFFVIWLMSVYDPDTLEFLKNTTLVQDYLSGEGYTDSGDLNRFTALTKIYNMFFANNLLNGLFGFGLGSCDTSSFAFLSTPFFKNYEYLHYRWFSHSWVYLEQGAIGLILLILFIVSILIFCLRRRKFLNAQYILVTLLFSALTLIGIIYNCALEVEASYLIAFMLAIPFIINKSEMRANVN